MYLSEKENSLQSKENIDYFLEYAKFELELKHYLQKISEPYRLTEEYSHRIASIIPKLQALERKANLLNQERAAILKD